jgi:hypothetical protein
LVETGRDAEAVPGWFRHVPPRIVPDFLKHQTALHYYLPVDELYLIVRQVFGMGLLQLLELLSQQRPFRGFPLLWPILAPLLLRV